MRSDTGGRHGTERRNRHRANAKPDRRFSRRRPLLLAFIILSVALWAFPCPAKAEDNLRYWTPTRIEYEVKVTLIPPAITIEPSGVFAVTCGGLNEPACTIDTDFFWKSGGGSCGRGLREENGICVNHHRKHPDMDTSLESDDGKWTTWAINNQRNDLAGDEPINWVMYLGGHNANSNVVDGYIGDMIQNEFYSMTDQMRAGVRMLELDVGVGDLIDKNNDWLRLVHAMTILGITTTGAGDRFFYDAVKEFKDWLVENPEDIIITHGDGWGDGVKDKLGLPILAYLGELVYKPGDLSEVLNICQGGAPPAACTVKSNLIDQAPRWPTRRELLAKDKQFIASGDLSHDFIWKGTLMDGPPGDTSHGVSAIDLDTCSAVSIEHIWDPSSFNNTWARVREARSGADLFVPWVGLFDKERVSKMARCNVTHPSMDYILRAWDTPLLMCASDDVPDPCPNPDNRLKGLVWSWKEGLPEDYKDDFNAEEDAKGYALFDGEDGRWASTMPEEEHPFACAVARDGEPLEWLDKRGEIWRVTAGTGPWSDGVSQCEQEFGPAGTHFNTLVADLVPALCTDPADPATCNTSPTSADLDPLDVDEVQLANWEMIKDGLVFSVPVNGWQNSQLENRWKDELGSGSVWLNYKRVQRSDDKWVWTAFGRPPIQRGAPINRRPAITSLAIVGGDERDEGEELTFEVDATDPDGDELTFEWRFGDGTAAVGGATVHHVYFDNIIDPCAGNTQGLPDDCFLVDSKAQKDCMDVILLGCSPEDGLEACQAAALDACPGVDFQFVRPPPSYPATVTVSDGVNPVHGSSSVTIKNVAPTLTTEGATIDENATATVSGAITDPGSQDSFTLVIDWGEGDPQTFTYPAGTTSFSEEHQYLDDNPTGTFSDIYPIGLTLTDDDGGEGTADTTVTVNTVAPVVSIDRIVDETGAEIGSDVRVVLIGLKIHVAASFTDVGTLDTHSATVDWGDGVTTDSVVNQSAGSGAVADHHIYETPGVYTLKIIVTDDDTAPSDAIQAQIEVVDGIGAVQSTVGQLQLTISDPTVDPAVAQALADALAKLEGNNGGKANNGALDQLEKSNLNAALLKIRQAQDALQVAEAGGDASLDMMRLKGLLALTAKSAAVEAIQQAEALADKSNEQRKVQNAKDHVAAGDDLLASGDYVGTMIRYQLAVRAVQSIT